MKVQWLSFMEQIIFGSVERKGLGPLLLQSLFFWGLETLPKMVIKHYKDFLKTL
jgi:hypothetical protein